MKTRALTSALGWLTGAVIMGALATGCGGSDTSAPASNPRTEVETALDAFAADLTANPATPSELPDRIRAYLAPHADFYGSTVALIGDDGKVFASPYVYRQGGALVEKDLVTPAYNIDEQGWLAEPRDSKQAVWTLPYFDAGGGEIWMVTRSVPLLHDGTVYAVATTDLPISAPAD